ncbi:MAG TPA: hypothetical protein VEO54_19225 [Thermoanaerobaculia bacterium]|nr:hypothetical protein [Thermoanaerobaculia bacterium]
MTSNRLSIPSSAIPQSSVVIPLQVFPAYNSLESPQGPPAGKQPAAPIYKVGINVSVTPSGQSAAFTNLYEFDTGGKGFFAGNVPTVVPPNPVGDVDNKYDSGISYDGSATYATIAFPDTTPPLTLPLEMLIGVITSVRYPGATNPQLPVFTSLDGALHLYGDFGMSLAPNTGHSHKHTTVPLLSVLAQLGSQYGGFIVDVGGYPPGSTPARVILGIAQLTSYFPNVFPMTAGGTYQPQDPPASQAGLPAINTFSAQPLTGTLQVGEQTFDDVQIVFDTGAPQTTIHNLLPPNTPASGQIILTVTHGTNSYEVLNFVASDEPGVNAVKVQGKPKGGTPTINTGLTPFFANPILFDLQNGTIGFV